MKTLSEIRKKVYKNGFGYAVEMTDAIEKKASRDSDYGDQLKIWLSGKGSTVLLRDTLCAPFKSHSFVVYYKGKVPMPWENMWQAIDAAAA